MNIRKLYLFVLLFVVTTLNAAEWQWSVQIFNVVSSEINDHPRAFLWIPENCKQVRAVVVGNNNMLEEGILEYSAFRLPRICHPGARGKEFAIPVSKINLELFLIFRTFTCFPRSQNLLLKEKNQTLAFLLV